MTALALCASTLSSAHADECDRSAFGSFTQKDLVDTRSRVLDHFGRDVVWEVTGYGRKRVISGTWADPYTGKTISGDASQIEIDHLIPVCWAWRFGANAWEKEKLNAFYNDEEFLVPVEAGINAQKGDRSPAYFLPMKRDFACEYTDRFLSGIKKYGLSPDADEFAGIEGAREDACNGSGMSPASTDPAG